MKRFWMRATVVVAVAVGLAAVMNSPRALRAAETGDQDPQVFMALANGSEEVPAVATPGTAVGRLVLSADKLQLIYEVRASGLTSEIRAMHLHTGVRGQAGNVVVPLATPVRGQAVGCVAMTPELADMMANQGLYLNIHTANNPAGEVRGQVIPLPQQIASP